MNLYILKLSSITLRFVHISAWLILLSGHAVAQSITIETDKSFWDLRPHMQILRAESKFLLSDVVNMPGWVDQPSLAPLIAEESLWGRIQLRYPQGDERYTIVIGNSNLDVVDIYVLDEKGRIRQSILTGASQTTDQDLIDHKHFSLPLNIKQNEVVNVYFRIQDLGPLVFPVELWQNQALYSKEQIQLTLIGFVGGALAFLVFYYLVSYVLFHNPIRFWFAVSSMLFLILVLCIESLLPQLLGLTVYGSEITTGVLALTLFTGIKTSHYMLLGVSRIFRYIQYSLCALLLISGLVLNEYHVLLSSMLLVGITVIAQFLFTIRYRNPNNSLSNRISLMGWLTLSAVALVQSTMLLYGATASQISSILLLLVSLSGVAFHALAVEVHEKIIASTKQKKQQTTIDELNHFYKLFRHSAEGLYTSTTEGKLISTNPAMFTLFGYDSEQQILMEVSNTEQLYAQPQDRQMLLLELEEKGLILGREVKGIKRDGSEFWFSLSVQLQQEGDERFLFGSIFDVDEKKRSAISLEYLAVHDSLTGTYNRRELERRLELSLSNYIDNKSEFSLLYMDLDQFKTVNDTCGHVAGDELLKQLSAQLEERVKDKGLLARLGGDEFALLIDHADQESVLDIANDMTNMAADFRFDWQGRSFRVGISVGVVFSMPHIQSCEQILSMADSASYTAKEQGKNQVHVYCMEDEKIQRYETELYWVTAINEAIENNQFNLYYQHYQPLTQMAEGHHYEVLLRLQHQGKQVSANAFLPTAEKFGLTSAIDKWVIEQYFKWLSNNTGHMDILDCCNINLNGHSLADKELKLFVLNAFETYNIPYNKICFEITESMAIIKMEETLQFINTFKKLGCRFALDDFGSGFSSYAYLKTLPVDYVKIDGCFVKDMLNDPVDLAMVKSINDIATAMNIESVAEYVESKEIMIELGKIGVSYAQGNGIAEAQRLDEFLTYNNK